MAASVRGLLLPSGGGGSVRGAERFIAALADIEDRVHLRQLSLGWPRAASPSTRSAPSSETMPSGARNPDLVDSGVPCCAITKLRVDGDVVVVIGYPLTSHLDEASSYGPV